MTLPRTRLALDCSFTGLSMVLQIVEADSFAFITAVPRSSDVLPTELANLFKASATSVHNLESIFVTTGPGSFTGIRLGLATAEALKLVNPAITITGLSTLHALATQIVHTAQPATSFTVVLDAAGQQAYTQTFSATGQPESAAACLPLTEIPTTGLIFAQSSLMFPPPVQPLQGLNATHLFTLSETLSAHLPAQPVYLKPLTYKLAQ